MTLPLAETWSTESLIAGIITPFIAIHMGAMTFYLRNLRNQHQSNFNDVTRRIENVAKKVESMSRRITDHERHFTAKEDWLRESMLARQNIERLTESIAHLRGFQQTPRHRSNKPSGKESSQ